MEPTRNIEHPSNRLYRGEITSFIEATQTYERAVRFELRVARDLEERYGITGDQGIDSSWADELAHVGEARSLYLEVMKAAEAEAIERLRKIGLDAWADALETGDYSPLAF